jgi:hypothetical protein
MSARFILLAIIVNILLVRCAFNSNDEYFNQLETPDSDNVAASLSLIDLVNYNQGDTIDLFGTTSFNFSLSGNHGAIESGTIFLGNGDSWTRLSNTNGNSFTINLKQLTNGIFVLRLELITKTGSGSLADAVGAEKFNLTLKWVVRVDLSLPPLPVPTFSVEDGYLTLRWLPYSKSNFQYYEVKRTLWNGSSVLYQINDKQTSTWRDEDYVGGYAAPLKYTVSIITEPGKSTSVPIARQDPMDVSFSFNVLDSIITVRWRPTKFFGTFKDYRFVPNNGETVDVTNFNDTTLTYKLSSVRFGGDSRVLFTTRSKSEVLPNYTILGTCKLGTPFNFKLAGRIKFNAYINSVIAVNEDKKLLRLDEQFEPVEEIATLQSTGWAMPYPGQHIYAYSNNNIYRLNLVDKSVVPYDYVYIGQRNSHTLASNGLICIDYSRPPLPSGNIPALFEAIVFDPAIVPNPTGFYDPLKGDVVYSDRSNTINVSAVISEDGKFIWVNNNQVFKITGGTSELIGPFMGSGSFVGFRTDNSGEMMFLDANKINIYDTNTLTYIRSISSPKANYNFVFYDPQSKNMLWAPSYTANFIYAVNIETGATKSISIFGNASASSFYTINGFLVYNGDFIKVNL